MGSWRTQGGEWSAANPLHRSYAWAGDTHMLACRLHPLGVAFPRSFTAYAVCWGFELTAHGLVYQCEVPVLVVPIEAVVFSQPSFRAAGERAGSEVLPFRVGDGNEIPEFRKNGCEEGAEVHAGPQCCAMLAPPLAELHD